MYSLHPPCTEYRYYMVACLSHEIHCRYLRAAKDPLHRRSMPSLVRRAHHTPHHPQPQDTPAPYEPEGSAEVPFAWAAASSASALVTHCHLSSLMAFGPNSLSTSLAQSVATSIKLVRTSATSASSTMLLPPTSEWVASVRPSGSCLWGRGSGRGYWGRHAPDKRKGRFTQPLRFGSATLSKSYAIIA
jgi:hypothetical protein